jgi:hypothetical protein
MNKKIRLPKELVTGSDQPTGTDIESGTDVEGHGWVNPAPPEGITYRSPSSGGEAVPTDDEGVGPEH